MKTSLLVAALLVSTTSLRADDSTREVQSALSEAGFFYGKADGTMGEETRAALKRFQIRNGLDVTGTATPETLAALKIGTTSSNSANAATSDDEREIAQSARPTDATPAPVNPPPPRPRPAPEPEDSAPVIGETRPSIARGGRSSVRDFFAGTDLENASPREQSAAVVKGQVRLSALGYYNAAPDGLPGPEMEEALLKFQHSIHLRLTGQLDADTRRALVDLPPGVSGKSFRSSQNRPPGSVLRGIWVH